MVPATAINPNVDAGSECVVVHQQLSMRFQGEHNTTGQFRCGLPAPVDTACPCLSQHRGQLSHLSPFDENAHWGSLSMQSYTCRGFYCKWRHSCVCALPSVRLRKAFAPQTCALRGSRVAHGTIFTTTCEAVRPLVAFASRVADASWKVPTPLTSSTTAKSSVMAYTSLPLLP